MPDQDLAIDFWLDVQKELQTTFRMPPDKAREAIDGYRLRMASHDAIDVVYHSDPQDIARDPGGGFRYEVNQGLEAIRSSRDCSAHSNHCAGTRFDRPESEVAKDIPDEFGPPHRRGVNVVFLRMRSSLPVGTSIIPTAR